MHVAFLVVVGSRQEARGKAANTVSNIPKIICSDVVNDEMYDVDDVYVMIVNVPKKQ